MECTNITTRYGGIPLYGIILLSLAASLFLLTVLMLELVLLPKRRRRRRRTTTHQTDTSHEQELLTHVVITGGSSGIGLSVAKELIRKGAKFITLLARNQTKLDQAQLELVQYAQSISIDNSTGTGTGTDTGTGTSTRTTIHVVSVDVSDPQKIIQAAKEICTPPDQNSNSNSTTTNIPVVPVPTSLLNVAGTSSCATFVDTDCAEFQRLMEINYLGSVYATRAFLPYMLQDSKYSDGVSDGHEHDHTHEHKPRAIGFTSSQAGQLGIYGFAAYSASKFALRGMAEALQMEVSDQNVSVQVFFPPDTDTPGFELECVDKPEITKLISETSGLFSSEQVAKKMVQSMLKTRPPFNVYIGLDGFMLSTLSAGMSPAHNMMDALCQIFLSGIFRFVSLFYLWDFRNTVQKVEKKNRHDGKGKGKSE